ncbi:MAG: sortase [Candidatus Thiodiazotropha sp.]
MARLGFPQRGLSLLVLSGDQEARLAFGPGWAERSAAPGEGGLSVISGHRDTHFRSLRDLQPGEIVTIQTSKGARVIYQVAAQPAFANPLGSRQQSERGGAANRM